MGMSQREVAKKMGVSRTRVFQIEQSALAKLRKRFLALGITREDVESFQNSTIRCTLPKKHELL